MSRLERVVAWVVHAFTPSRSEFRDEALLARRLTRIERERAAQVAMLKAAKQGPWAPAARVTKPRTKRAKAAKVLRLTGRGSGT